MSTATPGGPIPPLEAFGRDWFEAQYEEYSGLVLAFLRSRVGSASADDLSQQVWLKVWKVAATQFDGTCFRAWVIQIARNAVCDRYRRTRTYESLTTADAIAPADFVTDRDELLMSRTLALRECLQEISEELQAVIRARIVGEPYESISERLSIPLGTAHSRFNKAKSQLRKCVSRKLP